MLRTKGSDLSLTLQSFGRKQQGITFISILGLLAIFAFFLMIIFAIAPVYMENFKVKSHLSKMEEEPSLATMSDDDIVETLFRRFQIDDVASVKSEDVIIVRDVESTTINVSYVVYAPFAGNVEIVVTFNNKVTVEN